MQKQFTKLNKKQILERKTDNNYEIPHLFNEFLRSNKFAPPTIGKSTNSLVLQTWQNF